MSTDDGRSNPEEQAGSTVPDAPDGVGAGATAEPNTFEPEEAAPATGGDGGPEDAQPSGAAAGPAAQQDRQEPDDRGLTTDTTPSE